jgi:hypothetical protein
MDRFNPESAAGRLRQKIIDEAPRLFAENQNRIGEYVENGTYCASEIRSEANKFT